MKHILTLIVLLLFASNVLGTEICNITKYRASFADLSASYFDDKNKFSTLANFEFDFTNDPSDLTREFSLVKHKCEENKRQIANLGFKLDRIQCDSGRIYGQDVNYLFSNYYLMEKREILKGCEEIEIAGEKVHRATTKDFNSTYFDSLGRYLGLAVN